jgi:hypothetical protein
MKLNSITLKSSRSNLQLRFFLFLAVMTLASLMPLVALRGLPSNLATASTTFTTAMLEDAPSIISSTPSRQEHKPHHKTQATRCSAKPVEHMKKSGTGTLMSQNEEDVSLLETIGFNGICNGTYLEMGALNGVRYSNTHVFSKEFDWRGLLVEANPSSFAELQVNRRKDVTVHAAVCAKRQTVHFLSGGPYRAVDGILEFMSPGFKEKWWKNITLDSPQATTIECLPMSELLLEHYDGVKYFDIYSLDVEGAELQVLKSIDFDSYAFGVILLEANRKNDPIRNMALRTFLERQGYRYLIELNQNFWFVNQDFDHIYSDLL